MSKIDCDAPDKLIPLATDIVLAAKAAGLLIATAESCTAGLIIGTLTEIAGSSAARNRNDLTIGPMAAHLQDHLDPFLVRHDDIGDDEIIGLLGEPL